MLRFIGFYDYTVILTYLSLISALFGITQSAAGNFEIAVICMGICGVCDSFDGRIARTKKNRTDDEKAFGIQIDSLCDLVCFGIFPAFFCYELGLKSILGFVIICFYSICAVIRLGYYNVLEEKKKNAPAEQTNGAAFHGLPVTVSSILTALTYCLIYVLPENIFGIVLHIVPILIGFLFILDFPIKKKPSLKSLLLLIAVVSAFVIGVIWINVFGA